MPIHVSQHPLVLSKLTQLRLHDLPAKDFREGIKAIGWVVQRVLFLFVCHSRARKEYHWSFSERSRGMTGSSSGIKCGWDGFGRG